MHVRRGVSEICVHSKMESSSSTATDDDGDDDVCGLGQVADGRKETSGDNQDEPLRWMDGSEIASITGCPSTSQQAPGTESELRL